MVLRAAWLLASLIFIISCSTEREYEIKDNEVGILIDDQGKINSILKAGRVMVGNDLDLISFRVGVDTMQMRTPALLQDSIWFTVKFELVYEIDETYVKPLYQSFFNDHKARLIDPETSQIVREELSRADELQTNSKDIESLIFRRLESYFSEKGVKIQRLQYFEVYNSNTGNPY